MGRRGADGRAPHRDRRRGQQHQRGERSEHHRVPERERAPCGRGRRSGTLWSRPDHPRARFRWTGRSAATSGGAADLAHAGELRSDAGSRRPPARGDLKRSVVATRPARREAESAPADAQTGTSRAVSTPPQRLVVTTPASQEPVALAPRPPFGGRGRGTVERPMADRKALPAPPRPGVTSTGPVPQHPVGVVPSGSGQLAAEPGRAPARLAPSRPPAESPGNLRPRPSVGRRNAPGGALPATQPSTGAVPPAGRQVNPPPERPKGQVAPPGAARLAPVTPGPLGHAEPAVGPRSRGNGSPAAAGYSDGRPNRMAPRPGISRQPGHPLPGEPANRLAPGRGPRNPAPPGQPKG